MATGNDQVNPTVGEHDRVTMLTLNPDGTPRQFNPEIIGPKDVAIAAAKAQFAQQAVSAKDQEMRGVVAAGTAGAGEPDAAVAPLVAAHGEARDAAHAAAEAMVNSLHKGVGDPATPDAGKGTANPAAVGTPAETAPDAPRHAGAASDEGRAVETAAAEGK